MSGEFKWLNFAVGNTEFHEMKISTVISIIDIKFYVCFLFIVRVGRFYDTEFPEMKIKLLT